MYVCPAKKELTYRFSGVEKGLTLKRYFLDIKTCRECRLKPDCTKSKGQRKIARWEHQDRLESMEKMLIAMPEAMLLRKQTVEHPFGTIKMWMGATHFLTKRFKNVRTEMNLHVLAYNLKRMLSIFGTENLMKELMA